MLQQLAPPKPFQSYSYLSALLASRGMQIADATRAERKLSQVGYYRLSGFWYPCREFLRDADNNVQTCKVSKKPLRRDEFMPGTQFDLTFELYLFDKKLRQLMLDAIERIEVHVRSVIAHEVGYHDPMAYQDARFINPSQTKTFNTKQGRQRNIWTEWLKRQNEQIERTRDDSIEWHRQHHKAMPFWVVIEAWGIHQVANVIDSKPVVPGCPFAALGLPDETGFPRGRFGI